MLGNHPVADLAGYYNYRFLGVRVDKQAHIYRKYIAQQRFGKLGRVE